MKFPLAVLVFGLPSVRGDAIRYEALAAPVPSPNTVTLFKNSIDRFLFPYK